jgi:hypothetical protein
MFRPQLWSALTDPDPPVADPPTQDRREVWFAGVHGDVGGGYDEARSGLAKIPLYWMIDQARAAGLSFDNPLVDQLVLGRGAHGRYCRPDPHAERHESLRGAWWLLETLPHPDDSRVGRAGLTPRSWGMAKPRPVPPGALIHGSVLARQGDDRPGNLPDQRQEEPDQTPYG